MTATPLIINTIKPLIIPAKSKFYCLIGQLSGLDIHTFFQMGYLDINNNAHPLVELGKVSDGGLKYSDDGLRSISNALFSATGSFIKNEKRLLRQTCFTDLSFDMNYSAYKINNSQYLNFLSLLKQIELSNIKFFTEHANDINLTKPHKEIIDKRLFAYIPVGDNEYQYKHILDWDSGFNPTETSTENRQQIVNRTSDLSFNNTCRHTSIDFLDYILNAKTNNQFNNVPAFFITGMSCSTTMNSGAYTSKLYLLPLPPSAYELNSSQSKTLNSLFNRMEVLLQKDFGHPNTRQKFNLLNALYENLVSDLKPELCFLSIIVKHSLKPAHKEIIDTHRGWHWPLFHQTKTHQMFEQFQNDLNMKNSHI